MNCDKCRELLWDFDSLSADEQKEILEHIAVCPECQSTSRLICEIRSTEISPEISVADRVISRLEKERRTRAPLKLLRYAAAACLVLVASLVFLLPVFNSKTSDNAGNNVMDFKTETTLQDGSMGTINAPDYADEELFDNAESENAVEDYAPVPEVPESETPKHQENFPVKVPEEVPEADVQMKLNYYKDTFLLPSHSADIVLAGVNADEILSLLSPLNPERVENHIEFEGDVSDEVQKLLKTASIEPIYTTFSETVGKTLIFFEEYME